MCLGSCGKTNMAMVVSMVISNWRPQGSIELRYLGSCLNNAYFIEHAWKIEDLNFFYLKNFDWKYA